MNKTNDIQETRTALDECSGVGQVPSVNVHYMPGVPEMSWPDKNKRTGRPLNTISNLKHMLDHYGIKVCFDEIEKELLIIPPGQSGGPGGDDILGIVDVRSLCGKNDLPKGNLMGYLWNIGYRNPINPVMGSIQSESAT